MFRDYCEALAREAIRTARAVPTIETTIIILMAATVVFS